MGADHNTPRKEFKVKIRMRHPVLCKNWQNWFSDSYFQEKMLLMKFLHLSIFRKALKSLIKMSVACSKQQPPVEMCAWLYVPILLKSYIYWLSPLFIRNSSQSSLRDCLPGYNPQCGLNKIFYFFFRLLINILSTGSQPTVYRTLLNILKLIS